ncbi:hypothetical protein GYMLUDRAFT_62724 [Collybiopsis luxurians FD-317 M1]|uniref:Unplaced genomic scaffold GYMLUscaffold_61, whole genome shotgun sequence n=1 Tax=Collybiopsis luxurians FD-317 M1 TaxID=944289 RepID=A0A0D0AX14_9AGAR|nr:hypothetical protein GYMLUDRAFT_62724 [Collybiopsis luxurians FD-317 M1]
MSAYQKCKAQEKDVLRAKQSPRSMKRTKFSRIPLEGESSSSDSLRHPPLFAQPEPSFTTSLIDPELVFSTHIPHETEAEPEKKKSQTTRTMEEFMDELPHLMHLLLSSEARPDVFNICGCGSNLPRRFQCNDCFKYESSCETCFLEHHCNLPFHWARIWKSEGYYQKADISTLRGHNYAIHLCLNHGRCPSPSEPQKVTVVHTNGIHGTRLCYCLCDGRANVLEQCMNARLFPATVKAPRTFITFQALDEFTEHTVSSKKSAHRTTVSDIPTQDPQSQFLLVTRIWQKLCLEKWSGQAHDLLSQFSHRTPGSIVRTCYCCPEDGFNMEEGWERTLKELKWVVFVDYRHADSWLTEYHVRHLNQDQRTLDGNFHIGQYLKNCDPNDISLVTENGIGYFPDQTAVRDYLEKIPNTTEVDSACLIALLLFDLSLRNLPVITLTLSTIRIRRNLGTCFIPAWFKNSDFALMHSYSHTRHERLPTDSTLGASDFCLSYDCNCQYCVNLRPRFQASFPEYVPLINRLRCSIPALHIQDHKDDCRYKFNSAYMPNSGHFHGETAEQPWVELNQLAGSVRQMNSSHRIGVLTFHYGFWNWTKTTRMHLSLATTYCTARDLFAEKRRAYLSSCVQHHTRILEWVKQVDAKDQLPNEIVTDIYQHHLQGRFLFHIHLKEPSSYASLVPSREQIYQKILTSTAPEKEFLNNSSVYLIQLGVVIEHYQQRIMGKKTLNQTETIQKEILHDRESLTQQIGQFRELQVVIMPGVQDLVLSIPSDEQPELEVLYLPSYLPPELRKTRNLDELAELEAWVRVGKLYDCILAVRNAAKYKSLAYKDKAENTRGSTASTCSSLQIRRIEVELTSCIADYQRVRKALIQLNHFLPDQLPHMTMDSTYRRPSTEACRLGDSRRTDGQLYTLAIEFQHTPTPSAVNSEKESIETGIHYAVSSTHQVRQQLRHSGKVHSEHLGQPNKLKTSKDEGWIWQPETTFALLGVQVKDLTAFEDESPGDRIMHYRALAEMERWREVMEKAQSDYLNCMQAFQRMSGAWAKMADRKEASPSPSSPYKSWSFGHSAFARQQAKMYEQLYEQCLKTYNVLQFEQVAKGEILADVVTRQRARQEEEDRAIIEAEIRAAQTFLSDEYDIFSK